MGLQLQPSYGPSVAGQCRVATVPGRGLVSLLRAAERAFRKLVSASPGSRPCHCALRGSFSPYTALILALWMWAQRFREGKSRAQGSTTGTRQGRTCSQAESGLCRTPLCPPRGRSAPPGGSAVSAEVSWAAALLALELPDGRCYQRPSLVGRRQVRAFLQSLGLPRHWSS